MFFPFFPLRRFPLAVFGTGGLLHPLVQRLAQQHARGELCSLVLFKLVAKWLQMDLRGVFRCFFFFRCSPAHDKLQGYDIGWTSCHKVRNWFLIGGFSTFYMLINLFVMILEKWQKQGVKPPGFLLVVSMSSRAE